MYRLQALVAVEEETGTGAAVMRKALADDEPDCWAVQEKDDGHWYTVDTFTDLTEAEELLRLLLEGDE